MRRYLAGILLAGLLGEAASAAEIGCTITRTHKFRNGDVATHQVTHEFDLNRRFGGVMTVGRLHSFLLPDWAEIRFGFEVLNRNLQTRLSIESRSNVTHRQIHFHETFGSPTAIPEAVETRFNSVNYDFSVECSLNN